MVNIEVSSYFSSYKPLFHNSKKNFTAKGSIYRSHSIFLLLAVCFLLWITLVLSFWLRKWTCDTLTAGSCYVFTSYCWISVLWLYKRSYLANSRTVFYDLWIFFVSWVLCGIWCIQYVWDILLIKGIWERSLTVEHKSILSILGGVFDFPLRGRKLEGVHGYLQASGGRKAVDTRHRQ